MFAQRITALLSRLVTREVKMLAIVNRPVLMPKSAVCLAVASGTIHLFKTIHADESYAKIRDKWLRWGQMKVVVKAPDEAQLVQIYHQVRQQPELRSVLMWSNDSAMAGCVEVLEKNAKKPPPKKKRKQVPGEGDVPQEEPVEPNEPVPVPLVLCVIGPVEKLDPITKHLKLL